MILISKTYYETTPESAENGDFSDTGLVYENAEFTFRELVRELRDYSESSSYPCTDTSWVSTGFGVDDYSTGTETEYSLHFSRANPELKRKYWVKALRYAGFKI